MSMASSSRLLNRTAAGVRTSSGSLAFIRHSSNSSSPYPFTKSTGQSSSKKSAGGSTTPYPFTKPTAETKPTPPTRPTERPGPIIDESSLISREAAEVTDTEAQASWQQHPPYDYRASTFSPIPHKIMDGSEATETTPAAVLSGAPHELQARTVRIYKEAKPATQSGDWHSHHWRMDWDILPKGHRWENPLMGWQSSADFMQGTHLNFESKEAAIRFAEKQNYGYYVYEPQERRFVPKAYATQFVHSSAKLKNVRTK